MGQLDVVLGHPVGDVPEVAADVAEGRAVAQQAGGQRVPGLVGNPAADVELIDPGPEPEVEPLVGYCGGPVRVAVTAGEQRHRRPLSGGGGAAVPGNEPGHGDFPPRGQPPGQRLGDADRLVVAADLGLVVPEHGQPAVAAGAVQPQLKHLADPPPGDDDRFPDVAQPEVAGVMDLGEPGEVGLIGQGAGHLVGERAALAQRGGPGRRHRGDELPGQPDPLGGTAVQRPPQQLAGVVEGDGPGGRGDDRRVPSCRRITRDASPSRSRCRWSAANRWMCAAASCAGSWPPPGASRARNAPSSVAARRKASKVPPVRGQPGDRSRSAR